MRITLLFLLSVCAAGCAVDPSAYDARCLRVPVPANFNSELPSGTASGRVGSGAVTGTGAKSVPAGEVLEVNCGKEAYGVEGQPSAAEGEPQPL